MNHAHVIHPREMANNRFRSKSDHAARLTQALNNIANKCFAANITQTLQCKSLMNHDAKMMNIDSETINYADQQFNEHTVPASTRMCHR